MSRTFSHTNITKRIFAYTKNFLLFILIYYIKIFKFKLSIKESTKHLDLVHIRYIYNKIYLQIMIIIWDKKNNDGVDENLSFQNHTNLSQRFSL